MERLISYFDGDITTLMENGLLRTVKIGDDVPENKETFSIKPAYKGDGTNRKARRYAKPQAVKNLETTAEVDNQRRRPDLPPRYRPKCRYRDDTANGLTKCLIDYIKLYGVQAERINTTGIPQDTRRQVTDVVGRTRTVGSVTLRTKGGTKGSAYISTTIRGRSVKIEVKVGKYRQSQVQRQYQAAIEAAGGVYYVAKDFTSFVELYAQLFGKEA